MSISTPATPQEKILVAIRTSAIRLDIPLGSFDVDNQTVRPFGLAKVYLANLLRMVNEKFCENERRKHALFTSLENAFEKPKCSTPETKEERRARKRAEGLSLQKNAGLEKIKTSNFNRDHNYTFGSTIPLDQLTTL